MLRLVVATLLALVVGHAAALQGFLVRIKMFALLFFRDAFGDRSKDADVKSARGRRNFLNNFFCPYSMRAPVACQSPVVIMSNKPVLMSSAGAYVRSSSSSKNRKSSVEAVYRI